MAEGEGLTLTEEDFARTFGRTSREVIAALSAARRLNDAQIAALDAKKEAVFRRIIRDDVPLMPGAVALLQELRAGGFRLAVGSSAPPENVDLVLDWRNLRDLFDAAVTGRTLSAASRTRRSFSLPPNVSGFRPAIAW